MQQEQQRNFFGGGMDSDSAIEYIKEIDYLSAWNIRNTGTEQQEMGYITSIEGTVQIPFTLPAGINKCIGGKAFTDRRKAYVFIYNSNLKHLVLEYNYDTNTITKVFQNETDSAGLRILDLNSDNYVEDIDFIDEELYFLPSNRVPSKINVGRFKSGYYGVIRAEDLSVIQAKPTTIPSYEYYTDVNHQSNLVENQLIKLSVQYIYNNGQESVFSELSEVLVPNTVDTSQSVQNNALIISIPTGGDRVETIVVGAKYNNEEIWKEVKRIDRVKAITTPNLPIENIDPEVRYESYSAGIYKFMFYNDGLYIPIDTLTTDLEYDRVPKRAEAQVALNGSILAYGNLTEGFDPPTLDASVQVTYEKRIDAQAYTGDNRLEAVQFDTIRDKRSKKRNARFWFKGNIKNGDVITLALHLWNDPNQKRVYSYTCINFENNTLGALQDFCNTQILPVISPPPQLQADIISDYAVVDTVNGANYRLNIYGYLEAGKFEVRPALAGDINFTAISSLKLNSSRQYGLMYEYPYGRLGSVITNSKLIATTNSYGTTQGYTPIVTININNPAPADAIGVHVLSTGQTTHNNTVYMVGTLIDPVAFNEASTYAKGVYVVFDGNIQKSLVKDNADTPTNKAKWATIGSLVDFVNGSYLAFDITSLKRFNDTNINSVVNYDYTAGDRVNLISYFDGTTDTYFTPSPDVAVSGFEYDLLNNDKEDQDTGYILKIQKRDINKALFIGKDVFMEVYTPKKDIVNTSDKAFYTIGKRYNVTNGVHETTSIKINTGEVYFKTRNYVRPVSLANNREYLVEDFNYSDFADTRVDSLGRGYAYDKEAKQEVNIHWIRFSDIFNKANRLNLLNRFKTENVYGKANGQTTELYGGVMKMRQRASSLLTVQELETGYIPVNTTIYEDVTGQSNVAVSDKLLNNIRYNGQGYGIGRGTKSFVENDGDFYWVDPNKSEPVKADQGGIRSIAGKMSKFFRGTLQKLTVTKKAILGSYNSFYDEYILSSESDSGVVIQIPFNAGNWAVDNYEIPLMADITVGQPTNGTVTQVDGYIWQYVGNSIGADPFTIAFNEITRNACVAVVTAITTPIAYTFLDVINKPKNTVINSNTILIQGITAPANISIVDGAYEINASGVWLTAPSKVNDNDTVVVRRTSSGVVSTTVGTTLTVGSYSDTFSITTMAGYTQKWIGDESTSSCEQSLGVGNDRQSSILQKNNCAAGYGGTNVNYVVEANTFFGADKTEANNLALINISDNAQPFANTNGACVISTNPSTILIDFYDNNQDADICLYSPTVGVIGVNVPVSNRDISGTHRHFLPYGETEAINSYLLASDNIIIGSHKRRFGINLAKYIVDHPSIDTFEFVMRGRSTTSKPISGIYTLRTVNEGYLKMLGEEGTYMPTVVGAPPSGSVSYSDTIPAGGNGTVGITIGEVLLRLTYIVSTNTLTKSNI